MHCPKIHPCSIPPHLSLNRALPCGSWWHRSWWNIKSWPKCTLKKSCRCRCCQKLHISDQHWQTARHHRQIAGWHYNKMRTAINKLHTTTSKLRTAMAKLWNLPWKILKKPKSNFEPLPEPSCRPETWKVEKKKSQSSMNIWFMHDHSKSWFYMITPKADFWTTPEPSQNFTFSVRSISSMI